MPIYAQTTSQQPNHNTWTLNDEIALNRAKNYAREAAEKVNGGLSKYRAESLMYGPADEAPYVDNGNGTWTFTFYGHKPGTTTPSVKSIVTVAKNGSKVTVDYNEPINS